MHRIKCGHCSTYSRAVYHASTRDVRQCAFQVARSNMHLGNARAAIAQPRPNEWQTTVPRPMVEAVREGWYAVAEQNYRGDDFDHFTFFKVWKPTSGKRKGQTLIKTQHSETYKDFITIFPSGSVWFAQSGPRLDQALLMVCADPFTAARNYARLHSVCSCCHKKLTDERSRWYGIGPECKERWPEIIRTVNEIKGIGPNGGWFA